jgi:hypothetical protein
MNPSPSLQSEEEEMKKMNSSPGEVTAEGESVPSPANVFFTAERRDVSLSWPPPLFSPIEEEENIPLPKGEKRLSWPSHILPKGESSLSWPLAENL